MVEKLLLKSGVLEYLLGRMGEYQSGEHSQTGLFGWRADCFFEKSIGNEEKTVTAKIRRVLL